MANINFKYSRKMGRYESDTQDYLLECEKNDLEMLAKMGIELTMHSKFIIRKLREDEAHDVKKYPWIAMIWNIEERQYVFATWSPSTQAKTATDCMDYLNSYIENADNATKWSVGYEED